MEKRTAGWKTKGMSRDLSVSAHNPEFAFENMNLRLFTNDANTGMSWVNEQGTKQLNLYINTTPWEDNSEYKLTDHIIGTPIGTAVLNHYLIIFTTDTLLHNEDHIYKFKIRKGEEYALEGELLYKGNLHFNFNYPIETLVSYESNQVQKVYWTDGYNQPRLINIAASKDKLKLWNWKNTIPEGEPVPSPNEIDTYFDFIPSVDFGEIFKVEEIIAGGGMFSPGVIQYCFTYINKFGQQTNIIDVSPIYYTTHADRGGSPEDIVSNSFKITIVNPNHEFDYVRLYSIQRIATDAMPRVKLLEDILISQDSTEVSYIDQGIRGSTMDPTELLYVGGKEITALTMTEKDNTLFLGNLTQKNILVDELQNWFNENRGGNAVNITFNYDPEKVLHFDDPISSFYSNTHQLVHNAREITTFKAGEIYRFGFQLQKATGEWLEPVFIDDAVNDKYPNSQLYSTVMQLTSAESDIEIDSKLASLLDNGKYKRIKPVVVYPSIVDRQVLCQGVLNPTVFNIKDRIDKTVFSQSSWYFRPYMHDIPEHVPTPGKDFSENLRVQIESQTNISNSAPNTDLDNQYVSYFWVMSVTLEEGMTAEKYLNTQGIDGFITVKRYRIRGTNYSSPAIKYTKYPIIAIVGSNEDTNARQAILFLSEKQWPWEGEERNNQDGNTYKYTYEDKGIDLNLGLDISTLQVSGRVYPIYKNYRKTINNRIYYYKDLPELPEQYYTWLHTKRNADDSTYTRFKVIFTATAITEKSLKNYNISGRTLNFTHYESLAAESANAVAAPGENYEIQGAVNIYGNAYNNKYEVDFDSNNQFLIDQSILTFHSPDLEFDTATQIYDMEGVKLRIIGAVPITGGVSSHSITTKTTMLAKEKPSGSTAAESFGTGENTFNVYHTNIDLYGGLHLVADYLWNDVFITEVTYDEKKQVDTATTTAEAFDYLIYPWHSNGSLINDTRQESKAASVLDTKKEANLLYSFQSEYLKPRNINTEVSFSDISTQVHLTENAQIFMKRLPAQKKTSTDVTYYPNIDKVLYNTRGFYAVPKHASKDDAIFTGKGLVVSPVHMKYKSTTHAIIALNPESKEYGAQIPILPYEHYTVIVGGEKVVTDKGKYSKPEQVDPTNIPTWWGDMAIDFSQSGITTDNLFVPTSEYGDIIEKTHKPHNFLWLGELYKESKNPFGGTSEEALLSNRWLVGGEAKLLSEVIETREETVGGATTSKRYLKLKWTDGDTYYQRYDCLKTFPFTNDDPNQLVEILSFMCETHVNIDGRYDRNRGQERNYNMSPEIFNLYNEVYSQQNNFFTGLKTDNAETDLQYPNQVYFSKPKASTADVDMYTNITLASILELDGDKGSLNSLQRFNDQLIAFQDTGISQILYNENAQISTTAGVPIELANSGKVQGKRYLSDTVGCSNKWSVVNSPAGIYFMDSASKNIWLFNGQLNNLSQSGGFNTWAKQLPSMQVKWDPVSFNNYVSYYDRINQEVLFIGNETALAYSEKVGAFTSFYDYQKAPYFCQLDDVSIWINKSRNENSENKDSYKLWQHHAGDYCNFFDIPYPYYTILIGNPYPQTDKIFTNIDLRASLTPPVTSEGVQNDSSTDSTSSSTTFPDTAQTDEQRKLMLPFDQIEAWNEYQHGIANLKDMKGHKAYIHHEKNTIKGSTDEGSIKRKFRMWRCDIPRDNAPTEGDSDLGVTRFKAHPLDRIRNPWVYLKMYKKAMANMPKVEIHDILMYYYL